MKKPIVYYALAVYFGCFSAVIFDFSFLISISVMVTLFIVVYIFENLRNFSLLISFFIIGCVSCFIYFNCHIEEEACFRIIEVKKWYCTANYKGRIVQLYGKLQEVKAGEKIEAVGKFEESRDYSRGSIGKYYVTYYSKGKEDSIRKLYSFKDNLYTKYLKNLGEKKAAVVMACCYGDAKYLSNEQKNEFSELGIVHIISVSGFHIAIVYKLLEKLVGLRFALIISAIYMIFTGSEAATIRAFIMILALKCSKLTYKNYDSLSSLSLAALVLLLIKPYYVLDIGFNLSFLATLGIILYNKKLQRILYRLPKSINESLSITLSSQVFSMPYAMSTINNVSMFFVPGNLILVPLYSAVVILGNAGIVFYEFKPLFNIITSLLFSILTTVDGVIYILLKICPPVSKYNLFYGIYMIIIFVSIIFVKYGYKKVRHLPVVLLCLIIMYNMV